MSLLTRILFPPYATIERIGLRVGAAITIPAVVAGGYYDYKERSWPVCSATFGITGAATVAITMVTWPLVPTIAIVSGATYGTVAAKDKFAAAIAKRPPMP